MSVRHALQPRPRGLAVLAGVAVLGLAASGCSALGEGATAQADPGNPTTSAAPSPTPTPDPVSQASISTNLPDGAATVHVDKTVRLKARDGTFRKVRVVHTGEDRQRVAGKLSDDKTTWRASDRLEPGQSYRVRAVAVDSAGLRATDHSRFKTDDLTLDQQTYPSIAPLQDETVGVGMPVIIKFDVPVTDRAAIERHLHVKTTPHQRGSWSWLSDNQVHWRPKHHFRPGTKVTVAANIDSVDAGNGIYGQMDRSVSFDVGDSVVDKADLAHHVMRTYVNGEFARRIPVTGGKDGFTTRSGTKVIVQKYRHKHMDASTIGIAKDSPNYYDLSDVEYSMRITFSGEFLHAAPWSVGSQGAANVSHGCIGMSTSNAKWLFGISHRGDIVKVTGTDRGLEPGNGYTDWNESFAQFRKGSALH